MAEPAVVLPPVADMSTVAPETGWPDGFCTTPENVCVVGGGCGAWPTMVTGGLLVKMLPVPAQIWIWALTGNGSRPRPMVRPACWLGAGTALPVRRPAVSPGMTAALKV